MSKRFYQYLVGFIFVFLIGVAFAANEITVTPELQVQNGVFELKQRPGGINVDQQNQGANDTIQSIGTTTWELIVIAGDIATNGYAYFQNITTNTDYYVRLGGLYVSGVDTQFVEFIQLNANEVNLGRVHPTNAIYGKATGGAVNLRAIVLRD